MFDNPPDMSMKMPIPSPFSYAEVGLSNMSIMKSSESTCFSGFAESMRTMGLRTGTHRYTAEWTISMSAPDIGRNAIVWRSTSTAILSVSARRSRLYRKYSEGTPMWNSSTAIPKGYAARSRRDSGTMRKASFSILTVGAGWTLLAYFMPMEEVLGVDPTVLETGRYGVRCL